MFDYTYILELIASFFAVTVVLTLHEFSHSFVAYKCGDPTPKWSGRLSLNPLKHFDIIGLICFTLVGFGWAKPVSINPNNFKKYRLGLGLTASAGVVMNYISAFIFYPLYLIVCYYGSALPYGIYYFLTILLYYFFVYSLSFCVFNLLPLYPLDGFRLVDAINRKRGKVYRFLRQYGYILLLFLIVESFICNTFVRMGVEQMTWFNILHWLMLFGTNILGWPITKLWGLIIPW